MRFIIMTLALWRVSNLIVEEPGPKNIFRRLRGHFGIVEDNDGEIIGYNENDVVGMALTCVWCTSLWIAPVMLLVEKFSPRVVDALAASAGAIIVNEQLRK